MKGWVEGVTSALATGALACAVLVVAIGVLRAPAAGRAGAAELAASLALGLEFLLAAGLLRLSLVETYTGLAMVAALVVLRKVIGVGLRSGLRALGVAGLRLIRA